MCYSCTTIIPLMINYMCIYLNLHTCCDYDMTYMCQKHDTAAISINIHVNTEISDFYSHSRSQFTAEWLYTEVCLPSNHLMRFFRLSTTYQHGLHPQNDRLKIQTRLNRERGRHEWVGGWWWGVGGGGMSHPENPARGVSLWCPLCRADTIWPAGMLLSRGWRG